MHLILAKAFIINLLGSFVQLGPCFKMELIIKVKEIRTSFIMRNPYDDTYYTYLELDRSY